MKQSRRNQVRVMKVWGRNLQTGKVEVLDKSDKDNPAGMLVREYATAFGPSWRVWAGRLDDEPRDRV